MLWFGLLAGMSWQSEASASPNTLPSPWMALWEASTRHLHRESQLVLPKIGASEGCGNGWLFSLSIPRSFVMQFRAEKGEGTLSAKSDAGAHTGEVVPNTLPRSGCVYTSPKS